MTDTVSCAFISRHAPNEEQHQLAAKAGFHLVAVGDRNAFDGDALRAAVGGYPAACVVNPAAALALASKGHALNPFTILVFENGSRPRQGGPPAFTAVALHVFRVGVCGDFVSAELETLPRSDEGLEPSSGVNSLSGDAPAVAR